MGLDSHYRIDANRIINLNKNKACLRHDSNRLLACYGLPSEIVQVSYIIIYARTLHLNLIIQLS